MFLPKLMILLFGKAKDETENMHVRTWDKEAGNRRLASVKKKIALEFWNRVPSPVPFSASISFYKAKILPTSGGNLS